MSMQVGDRIKVTAVMELGAAIMVNNVYEFVVLELGTDDDDDRMDEMAAWVDDAYTWIGGVLSNAVVPTEIRGYNVTRDEPLATKSWPTWTGGTGSGEYAPSGVAALVSFRTAKARVLARKYLGVLVESVIGSNGLTAGAISSITSYAIHLLSATITTAGGSHLRYGVFDKAGAFHILTNFVVAGVLAYQRRRKPGRGA